MEPLTVVAASFTLPGCIVKTTLAITELSAEASDARGDLDAISKELQL